MNSPMAAKRRVLMVASENDALPGAKVGGIGDVVRDVPGALARRGIEVCVLTPAYGFLAAAPGAARLGSVSAPFGLAREPVVFFEVRGRYSQPGVRHVVADHPGFAACGPRVYCDDPPETPFATDATKFALFCAAAVEGLAQGVLAEPDLLHLHDWHAALVLALARFAPAYRALRGLRSVYTIHNLALQGIRPFAGHPSSLRTWYPDLTYDRVVLADPRWPHCVNPMAVGVRLADVVHTVSPTYAREILEPSAVGERGYYGGEGLEGDLRRAHADGRLVGILNGCEYPDAGAVRPPAWRALREMMSAELLRWAGAETALRSVHYVAAERLRALGRRRPGTLLTSVSRVTEQKVRLLAERDSRGQPALEGLLETLGEQGLYVFLGTGDPVLEGFLAQMSARHPNFVFLRGYSEPLSSALYASGDLFVMPSSFEPCGISQMLALRAGQPCLVHHVGGLRDTVADGETGFAFRGDTLTEQADALVAATRRALALKRDDPARWRAMRKAAAAARFSWDDTASAYIERLYAVAA